MSHEYQSFLRLQRLFKILWPDPKWERNTMKKRTLLLSGLAALGILAIGFARSTRADSADDARKALDSFNHEFMGACQKMDHRATAALWAEDGADLLPGMAPMVGQAKIAAWLDSLTPQLAGAKMVYCTVDWQDIQVHGDLAYEWGINRQKIEFPPPGKTFENEGKILLVLKRQSDKSWRIALESWNSNPPPQEKR
jgi:ketosteroid isomerase-like protein